MRITIIVLVAVLAIGGSVIALGFLTEPEYVEEIENLTPFEKLQNYRDSLEEINQYNQKMLDNIEKQIENSDNENIEQLKEEIKVLERVISENKAELDRVIQQLSEMQSSP